MDNVTYIEARDSDLGPVVLHLFGPCKEALRERKCSCDAYESIRASVATLSTKNMTDHGIILFHGAALAWWLGEWLICSLPPFFSELA